MIIGFGDEIWKVSLLLNPFKVIWLLVEHHLQGWSICGKSLLSHGLGFCWAVALGGSTLMVNHLQWHVNNCLLVNRCGMCLYAMENFLPLLHYSLASSVWRCIFSLPGLQLLYVTDPCNGIYFTII